MYSNGDDVEAVVRLVKRRGGEGQGTREPEVAIRLTSTSARINNQIRYDFTLGSYQRVYTDDLLLDLLTLPSRIIHVDLQEQQQQQTEQDPRAEEAARIMEENLAMQTEPPPSTAFTVNVGPAEVYDAYQKHYLKILEKEREREREKEREREIERERERERGRGKAKKAPAAVASDPLVLAQPLPKKYSNGAPDLTKLNNTARVVERMVNQNTYDDISQDFKYWEDGSDEFRPLEGSLLPLWKFSHERSRTLIVSDVVWVKTEPGEELCLYSVAMDGRLTQWQVRASALVHTDILHFLDADLPSQHFTTDKILLEGIGTCAAFRPDDGDVVLVGVDTGAVFQCSTLSTVHALTRYPAHTAAVRAVVWNIHHHKVFISCSVDWTVKVWFQYHLSPLVVLDLGGAVAGVTWSPYSSSVFVAVSDEGRVHVYDLFTRKCRPLCVQSLVQRRRVAATCVSFNPFHPVIMVGGEKGNLVCLKLSPNLRKIHKDAKGADDMKLKEIELCKMERLIATNRG
ncbi:Dynein intermediate chain 1- axonemal-like 1 [Homarus americanus]|uniref:Dynein intermediate chain 1- axonemal-like 1 n=1 Tax=Homarus americanus TaxID=6706 RepID=A0A8J5MSU9_HOMAM|nr:Dynein intermediate chain 1- axonemal-like 1 [Homarus americanus]